MALKVQPIQSSGSLKNESSPFPKHAPQRHSKICCNSKGTTFRAILARKLME